MLTSIRQSETSTVTTYTPNQFRGITDVFNKVTAYSKAADSGILEVTTKLLGASRAAFVARGHDGDFLGFTRLIDHQRVAEIGTLWVPGRGAAKLLIEAATNHALKNEMVPVAIANDAAFGVFDRAGFEPMGRTDSGKTLMMHHSVPESFSPYEAAEAVMSLPRFAGTSMLHAAAA